MNTQQTPQDLKHTNLSTEPQSNNPQLSDKSGKRTMLAAWIGYFSDLFDIYLPVIVLAPVMFIFLPDTVDPQTAVILGGFMFAATIVARPIGSLAFGWIADNLGRRRASLISLTGAAAAVMLMAVLPVFEQVGLWAIGLFILLRFIAGIFLGGAYTGANPLAMENAPIEKRGLYSAIINTGFPISYAAVSLLTFFMLILIPADGPDSPFASWGWRIPFVMGALMSVGIAVYVYLKVPESKTFEDTQEDKQAQNVKTSPIRILFQRDTRKIVLQVFVMMTGLWLATQPIAAVLPTTLVDDVGLSGNTSSATLVIAYLCLAGMNIIYGLAGQRFGRKPVLIFGGLVILLGCSSLYYVIIEFGPQNHALAVACTIAMVSTIVAPFGLAPAYINERFPTKVRATGYGFAYGISVVIPSFFGFYQAGLGTIMPVEYTTIVLIALGGLLAIIGASLGPETKHLDLSKY